MASDPPSAAAWLPVPAVAPPARLALARLLASPPRACRRARTAACWAAGRLLLMGRAMLRQRRAHPALRRHAAAGESLHALPRLQGRPRSAGWPPQAAAAAAWAAGLPGTKCRLAGARQASEAPQQQAALARPRPVNGGSSGALPWSSDQRRRRPSGGQGVRRLRPQRRPSGGRGMRRLRPQRRPSGGQGVRRLRPQRRPSGGRGMQRLRPQRRPSGGRGMRRLRPQRGPSGGRGMRRLRPQRRPSSGRRVRRLRPQRRLRLLGSLSGSRGSRHRGAASSFRPRSPSSSAAPRRRRPRRRPPAAGPAGRLRRRPGRAQ
jgi:hypothetical protein